MRKYLIVNADDFGISEGINRGILEAHLYGIVTSTSLMPNGLSLANAILLAKSNPSLGVGIHINIVEGKPLSNGHLIPSLVNKEGNFVGINSFLLKLLTGQLNQDDLLHEIKNQVSAIYDSGIKISHLDSHKHVHVFPKVRKAFAQVAAHFRIKAMRFPYQDQIFRHCASMNVKFSQYINTICVRTFAKGLLKLLEEKKFLHPDRLIGLYETGYLETVLSNILTHVDGGITEIMAHPGYADTVLEQWGTRLLHTRRKELDALKEEKLKEIIKERDIHLIGYNDLPDVRHC